MIAQRQFGRTGLTIPELGLGTWALGGDGYGPMAQPEAFRILGTALEGGVLFWDTADFYGFGESEHRLGCFMKERACRGKIFLATKGGLRFQAGPVRKDFTKKYLAEAVRASLARLGSGHIDLYQLHGPRASDLASGECLRFLAEAKREGLIRFGGVSLHDPSQAKEWLKAPEIDAVQLPANLIDRRLEAFLPFLRRAKKALIVREVFCSGFLTGKYGAEARFPAGDHRRSLSESEKLGIIRKIRQIRQGTDLMREAVRFALQPPEVSAVLLGVSRAEQLESNLKIYHALAGPERREGLFGSLPSLGVNKREELRRLLHETAIRENSSAEEIEREAMKHLGGPEGRAPRFREVKSFLVEKRYPELLPSERSRVLLTRLPRPEGASEGGCLPKRIVIESSAAGSLLAKRVGELFPDTPRETIDSLKDLRRPRAEWRAGFGKDTLCVTREKFDFIKRCPCSRGALQCGYTILNLGFGCPYDCSYCYLQFYQNTPAILLYANPEDFCRELDMLFQKKGPAVRRLGTGEFTDSLALDRVTEYSKILVPYFKDKPCWFELKTKSACVENLLGLEHGGRTVVSWSLSLERHAREETGAPPVAERIRAARRAEAALYPVAFHFDPIFYEPGWEDGYEELVNRVFDEIRTVPRWISLGAFRCHRDLKRVAEARHPRTRIFLGEQVPEGASGKFQYPERFRVEIYRKMLAWIRKRSPRSKVYLCMEPPGVWSGVFGSVPKGRLGDWLAE